jgi:starch synthase
MVASECEPFAKTGGLADVVDALSRALGARGHGVDVFLPRFRGVEPPPGSVRESVSLGDTGRSVTLWTGAADGYRVRLVDDPPSYDRDGLYGDAAGDFPDNAARFALLGQVVVAAIDADPKRVDVVHGHDWQAGPCLLLLRDREDTQQPRTGRPATVLTCHNLAYHGWVPADRVPELGLAGTEGWSGVDLLRAALERADLANTVSPTFARESRSPGFGAGVDDLLRALGDRYGGILNGIDVAVWDPATDPAIPAPYGPDDLEGKARCRADLCARHGLDPDGTVMGMVGRLDPQKGFDLVAGALPTLLDRGARLVVLGTGDAALLAELREVARARPDRVVVVERFDRDEARRIYAGADVFLMPSRFEPSGQGQLIALRYGTVPLVRRTGGLADTIRDADVDALAGNGFVFDEPDPHALVEAARRAIAAHRDPDRWRAIVRRGMAEDHGWERPAEAYERMYERALASRAAMASPSRPA